MKNSILTKISVWTVSCMLFLLLSPITTYAYYSYFTYDESNGLLYADVYLEDPNSVVISVTQEDYTVTEYTYTDIDSQFIMGYSDDNQTQWFIHFKFENIFTYPKEIEITADQRGPYLATPNKLGSPNFTQYDKDNASQNVRVDSYRIPADEQFSSLIAGSYVPANTPLFSFIPSDDENNGYILTNNLNAIQINFGAENIIKWSNLVLEDIVLLDLDDQSEVEITGIQPVVNIDWINETKADSTSSMIILTAVNLQKGHTYSIATSAKASGNEIKVPVEGKYDLGLWLGEFKSYDLGSSFPYTYEILHKQNAHLFDQVSIKAASSGGDGSGGGTSSGSSVFIPPVTPQTDPGELKPTPVRENIGGVETDTYKPDKKDVEQAIKDLPENTAQLTIRAAMDGEAAQVILPADTFANAERSDLVLSFDFGDQAYELPIQILNLDDIASELQADLSDISLQIAITKQTGETAENIQQTVANSGANLLSDAFEFTLIAEANGKQTELNDFGNTYVSRSIQLDQEADPNSLTGVTYNPETKELRFVPAIVTVKDGKTIVTLKRTGNSIYAVVESNKSFSDIAAHWARDDIKLLGSKLIVQGVNEHEFAPDRTMTRAEYTALLVRSLGLNPVYNGKATFDDVAAEDWYFGEIEAAVMAGLVAGDGSGNFNPNEPLTREQAAVLTASALKFAGVPVHNGQVNSFADTDVISKWAVDSVNVLQALNVLSGMPNGTFEPQRPLTRAEAVTILKRFLLKAEFMN